MVNTLLNSTSPSLQVLRPSAKPDSPMNEPEPIAIQKFSVERQASIFKKLKEIQFSGELVFRNKQGIESILYLFLGRIVFATGGHHPIRRWTRNLTLHCPNIASDVTIVERDIQSVLKAKEEIGWQYQLLSLWIKKQIINREQVINLIRGILSEVLFDLIYDQELTYQVRENKPLSTPLVLINHEEIIVEIWKLWQSWQAAKLGNRSPNLAPVIKNLEQLKQQTSPITSKMLRQRLDGETTLRDLAISLRQDVLQLTRSLSLYIRRGLVELVEISDLPGPDSPNTQTNSPAMSDQAPLVAYVDDNPGMCQRMKYILNQGGYEFCAVQDWIKAIAVCLEKKPDVIVVSAKNSYADSYTLCYELRQLQVFRHTPILMIVHKDTLIDRIRAKMLGISDILEVLAQPEEIISRITKFLAPQMLD